MRQATISDKPNVAPPKIEYYFKFHGKRCVRIKGNFWYGGFSLSQSKAAAIMANLEAIKDFAAGRLNQEIDGLEDKAESREAGDEFKVLIPDC